MTGPRLVRLAAHAVSVVCVGLLLALVVFDAHAERITAGLTPSQFRQALEAELLGDYGDVLGIAHNAGDDLSVAMEAAAYGVDAIEIDVTSVGGGLHASHDAPVPLVDTLFFRGPDLEDAWDVARLRPTVVLDLKERGEPYLEQVAGFLASRQDRRVIIQTRHRDALRTIGELVPEAELHLLLFSVADFQALREDPELIERIDGASVRHRHLTPARHRALKAAGLRTFAWTVNDEERLNELVAEEIDGIITDRLEFMALLGGRRDLLR
jgi:glycerophosphoryl diester phosphodiesterase